MRRLHGKMRVQGHWQGWFLAVAAGLLLVCAPASVRADDDPREALVEQFLMSLDASARPTFEQWISAQAFHEFELEAYWRQVSDKRSGRRAKRASGITTFTVEDYVLAQPPEYKGDVLPADLAKAWADFQAKAGPVHIKEPPKPVATLAESIAAAKAQFSFEPVRIPEREFKVRYAREALALGLRKDQVVRIYALETGGIGTADMQAGIHPLKKTGTAISTAVGYAQLLNANSVEETAKHGTTFLARLKVLANRLAGDPAKAKGLKSKLAALNKMVLAARSVGPSWEAHVAYAATPKGLGIHALNVDGDVGPWLQAVKLKGLKELADKSGRTNLAGNEIELMNLAGPATGLEMMAEPGLRVPTANFFTRAAYSRNSIVRGRTSAELLAAIDKRMDENVKNPGAVEFAAAFDEVTRAHQAQQAGGP